MRIHRMLPPEELPPENLLQEINTLARQAGARIMEIYRSDFDCQIKQDGSPVTAADREAEAIILAGLTSLTPDIPVVSEEDAERAAKDCPSVPNEPFWLVDPLDGTREFIRRNGEFSVNIALIEQQFPVLGCVFLPALDRLYSGRLGGGATCVDRTGLAHSISVRTAPADGLVVLHSRDHGDLATIEEFLSGVSVREYRGVGSSLKLCLLAEGEAGLYPRLGRTMEWDIAAGHAVLAAAGGTVTRIDGTPFTYGKQVGFANPHFVAFGGIATLIKTVL